MAENWSTVLPMNVQKMIISGLEREVSERRALIQREKQAAKPDTESIQSWQKDIAYTEDLRNSFL